MRNGGFNLVPDKTRRFTLQIYLFYFLLTLLYENVTYYTCIIYEILLLKVVWNIFTSVDNILNKITFMARYFVSLFFEKKKNQVTAFLFFNLKLQKYFF